MIHHVLCATPEHYIDLTEKKLPEKEVFSSISLTSGAKNIIDLQKLLDPYSTDDFQHFKDSVSSVTCDNMNINGLEMFADKVLIGDIEREFFFRDLFPRILELATSFSKLLPKYLPTLGKNVNSSITLSQEQIGCLLANGFFCTLPKRNIDSLECQSDSYPDFNFTKLYESTNNVTVQKLKCLFHYFDRITSKVPQGIVTFTRQFLSPDQIPNFLISTKELPKVKFQVRGLIEDAEDHLQMDFADRYIGGLLYTAGCLQEQVRFMVCPELIVARLFTEKFEATEALLIEGVERFNTGRGYGDTFSWSGSYLDHKETDAFGRRETSIVAIDALNLEGMAESQYCSEFLFREIYKAYVGFRPIEPSFDILKPVATGNWGCGVFGGNPKLKVSDCNLEKIFIKNSSAGRIYEHIMQQYVNRDFLLQVLAAGEAGRDLSFFSSQSKLVDEMSTLMIFLHEHKFLVGSLTKCLMCYDDSREKTLLGNDIFEFVRRKLAN